MLTTLMLLLAPAAVPPQAPHPPQAPPSVRACDCRTVGPSACDCKSNGTACHGTGCGCHDDCTCLVGARPPLVVRGRKVVLPPRTVFAPPPAVIWEVVPSAPRTTYYAAPPHFFQGFRGGAASCGPGG